MARHRAWCRPPFIVFDSAQVICPGFVIDPDGGIRIGDHAVVITDVPDRSAAAEEPAVVKSRPAAGARAHPSNPRCASRQEAKPCSIQ